MIEWQTYKSAQPVAEVLDIQQYKDRIEHLASELNTGLFCLPTSSSLEQNCIQFETEFSLFKEKIFVNILTGRSRPYF